MPLPPRGRRGLRPIIFRAAYEKSRIRRNRIRMSGFLAEFVLGGSIGPVNLD